MAEDELVALTIKVPLKIHEKFRIKSITDRPRRSMRDRIVAFMAGEVGEEVPVFVDKRKLKRKPVVEEPPPREQQKGRKK